MVGIASKSPSHAVGACRGRRFMCGTKQKQQNPAPRAKSRAVRDKHTKAGARVHHLPSSRRRVCLLRHEGARRCTSVWVHQVHWCGCGLDTVAQHSGFVFRDTVFVRIRDADLRLCLLAVACPIYADARNTRRCAYALIALASLPWCVRIIGLPRLLHDRHEIIEKTPRTFQRQQSYWTSPVPET